LRCGLAVVPVEISEVAFLEALIASGRCEVDALDRDRVAKAASEILQEWASRWTNAPRAV